MKTFLRVTGKEMSYGIRNVRFWGTVIALTVLMLLDAVQQLSTAQFADETGAIVYNTDILTLTIGIIGGGCYMFWARFCLFAVPFGCCFYDEYSQCASKYRLTRTNSRIYGLSKMTAGVFLTGATVILANLGMLAVLKAAGLPFLLPEEFMEIDGVMTSFSATYYSYGLVDAGHPVLFYLLLLFFASLAGMFFSAMTIMLSAYIRNKYILIAMPLALFFSIDSLCSLYFYPNSETPVWLSWRTIFFGILGDGQQTELAGVARTILYTAAGLTVFSFLFVRRIREVSENE
ncbi:MAG: hypothetical protein LUE29_05070 [Lachnospiraceae bacterium]|nr:hypothetical protein [Lachnospiraceae bacterium]